MNLVGIFSPEGAVLLESGPVVTGLIVFTTGTVATIAKDVTVGSCGLVIVVIINLGYLNGK